MRKKKIIKKKFDKNYLIKLTIMKIIIILFLITSFYITNKTFQNKISVLAVHENENGDIVGGSKIDLNLKIERGNGQIFVNLDSVEEIDTQISIINSNKITCELFNLDCNKYNFYYSFDNSALILKGPSASSAIAVLTAKTVLKEKMDKNTVITGSLASGGIIGNVGGIDKKIEVAENMGFEKIVIPIFSKYNKTKNRTIEVLPAIDIIDAYNHFNGKQKIIETKKINLEEYTKSMKLLADLLCTRSEELKNQINTSLFTEDKTYNEFLKTAELTHNNSLKSKMNEKYYSQASFCYNSNVNYRNLIEYQKKLSKEEIIENLENLTTKIETKYQKIKSLEYIKNIKTINDFYTYLILNDRISESQELITQALEKLNEKSNLKNISSNETIQKFEDSKLKEIINIYSSGIERFYTVNIWEQFITENNNEINLKNNLPGKICQNIANNINLKTEVIKRYGINSFNSEIIELNELNKNLIGNKYLCIYKGLELNGKIDTILNSVDIEKENLDIFANTMLNITYNRLSNTKNDIFPLIPYIYYEYADELLKVNNSDVAILYSNYALSYLELDNYFKVENPHKDFIIDIYYDMFNFNGLSILFLIGMLVILAFLEHDIKNKKK